jgi:hypothetical protein
VSRRRELALLLALVVATAVLAVVPGLDRPFARLANYDADTRDPIYDADVDGDAIRRAASLLPERTTYYVHTSPSDPLLIGNLKAAGQLFFAPALPVLDVADARWVLSYRAERLLPGELRAERRYRLGDGIYLIEVAA